MSDQKITPFLMFFGRAEEAINYYITVFERSEVISIQRYVPGAPGAEGKVIHATFSLNGQTFMAIDSDANMHKFGFTPAISFWIACESEDELDRLVAKLSAEGSVLMPPGNYGFSRKFAWVGDKFGVTWQLNLA